METIICIAILGVQLGLFIYIKWSVGDLLHIQEKHNNILRDFLDTIKTGNEINELTNKVIERQTNAIKIMSDGVQAIIENEVKRSMSNAEYINDIISKNMKHE